MADERRPHPAPLPADADPSEARLAEAWRALEAADDEGPSELADARILRAAREAMAADAGPAYGRERVRVWRWSAAAALVLSIGTGLLIWREVPDGPDALVGAESRQAPAAPPVPSRAASPPPAAKTSSARAELSVPEEIAIAARREAVPVATLIAPAGALADFAEDTDADTGANAEFAGPSPLELEGRIRERDGRWYLDRDEGPLVLDLSKLPEKGREALEDDTPVRVWVVRGEETARVIVLEVLPD